MNKKFQFKGVCVCVCVLLVTFTLCAEEIAWDQTAQGWKKGTTVRNPVGEPLSFIVTDSIWSDTKIDLTLTDTGTIYSYTLPVKCTMYEYQSLNQTALKCANSAGGIISNYISYVAPYNTPDREGANFSGTLYFKDESHAGTIVELRIWTKP